MVWFVTEWKITNTRNRFKRVAAFLKQSSFKFLQQKLKDKEQQVIKQSNNNLWTIVYCNTSGLIVAFTMPSRNSVKFKVNTNVWKEWRARGMDRKKGERWWGTILAGRRSAPADRTERQTSCQQPCAHTHTHTHTIWVLGGFTHKQWEKHHSVWLSVTS